MYLFFEKNSGIFQIGTSKLDIKNINKAVILHSEVIFNFKNKNFIYVQFNKKMFNFVLLKDHRSLIKNIFLKKMIYCFLYVLFYVNKFKKFIIFFLVIVFLSLFFLWNDSNITKVKSIPQNDINWNEYLLRNATSKKVSKGKFKYYESSIPVITNMPKFLVLPISSHYDEKNKYNGYFVTYFSDILSVKYDHMIRKKPIAFCQLNESKIYIYSINNEDKILIFDKKEINLKFAIFSENEIPGQVNQNSLCYYIFNFSRRLIEK